jgi:WD40 repeat protein
LEDGKHFVSGSFDHFLNVYSFKKRELAASVNTGEKVTMLTKIVGKNGQLCIVSGHLGVQLGVWRVCKNNFNNVVGVEAMRKIKIETIPYSIVSVGSNESVATTGKDGKLKVIDVSKGVIQREHDIGQCF